MHYPASTYLARWAYAENSEIYSTTSRTSLQEGRATWTHCKLVKRPGTTSCGPRIRSEPSLLHPYIALVTGQSCSGVAVRGSTKRLGAALRSDCNGCHLTLRER